VTATGEIDEEAFRSLLDKIAAERRFECDSYKAKCLRRRIAVRLRARGVHTYGDYAAILDSDPGEYDKLIDVLTINVTKLFRNWETYSQMARVVVPSLVDQRSPLINVWSAGCASGEEAYSLAILFHRHGEASGNPAAVRRVRVIGTDIDARCLSIAERGVYTRTAFGDTPDEIRKRYFSDGESAHVDATVRSMVRFTRHDLLQEPALRGQHLIVCRNVIIYFERHCQEGLFERFHAALAPGGFLVLGRVETLLGGSRRLFRSIDARERIFQKADAGSPTVAR